MAKRITTVIGLLRVHSATVNCTVNDALVHAMPNVAVMNLNFLLPKGSVAALLRFVEK